MSVPGTVLVIDDEPIIRERLGKLLRLDGYTVHTAASGSEGVELCRTTEVDVVLSDIKMPGMSGTEVLEALKEVSPHIEIIMITGHGGVDTAIQALREGAFDYTTKPIVYDELHISITRALRKRALALENRKLKEALHAPLNEIITTADSLLGRGPPDEEREQLERILRAGKVLEGILESMRRVDGK